MGVKFEMIASEEEISSEIAIITTSASTINVAVIVTVASILLVDHKQQGTNSAWGMCTYSVATRPLQRQETQLAMFNIFLPRSNRKCAIFATH